MVEVIERKKIVYSISEQICRDIANGVLKPGERLPSIKELAERFNVSTSSVREALQQMEAIGLISIQQGRGCFVSEELVTSLILSSLKILTFLKSPIFLELLQLRKVIERETALLASKNVKQKDIEELEKVLEAMKKAKENDDIKEFVVQDIKFHFLIAKASKNTLFSSILNIIHGTFLEQQEFVASLPGALERAYSYHLKIYEAIRAKNSRESQRQMLAHLKDIEKNVKRNIKGI